MLSFVHVCHDNRHENEEALQATLKEMLTFDLGKIEQHVPSWLVVTYAENSIDLVRLADSGVGQECIFVEGAGMMDTNGQPVEEKDVVLPFKKYFREDNICFVVFRGLLMPGDLNLKHDSVMKYIRPYYGIILWEGWYPCTPFIPLHCPKQSTISSHLRFSFIQGPKIEVMAKALSSHHFASFSSSIKQTFEKIGGPLAPGHIHANSFDDIAPSQLRKLLFVHH